MPAIWVKDKKPREGYRRGKLWEAIERKKNIVNSIKEPKPANNKPSNKFIIICDEENYENILNSENRKKFDNLGFEIQILREYN